MDIQQNDERYARYNQPEKCVWNHQVKNNREGNKKWNKIFPRYPCKNAITPPKIRNMVVFLTHSIIHITAFVIGLLTAFHSWNHPYLILRDERFMYCLWYTTFYFSYWLFEIAYIESLYPKIGEIFCLSIIILNFLLTIIIFIGMAITGNWLILVSFLILFTLTAFALLQFTGLRIY